jgi:hypothetical protein
MNISEEVKLPAYKTGYGIVDASGDDIGCIYNEELESKIITVINHHDELVNER